MKFKCFNWWDDYRTPLAYVEANSYDDAKQKLKDSGHWSNISSDLKEVQEFIQPDPIPIIL